MELRTCRLCCASKPHSEFYSHPRGRLRLAWRCKACERARARAWARDNREKARAANRRWIANNRDRYLDIQRRSDRNNPLRAPRQARRRALLRGAAYPAWANDFFIQEAYSLARLRTKATGVRWHVDHIVPLQHPLVCGLHTDANLSVIPMLENSAKGNRRWPDMPMLKT